MVARKTHRRVRLKASRTHHRDRRVRRDAFALWLRTLAPLAHGPTWLKRDATNRTSQPLSAAIRARGSLPCPYYSLRTAAECLVEGPMRTLITNGTMSPPTGRSTLRPIDWETATRPRSVPDLAAGGLTTDVIPLELFRPLRIPAGSTSIRTLSWPFGWTFARTLQTGTARPRSAGHLDRRLRGPGKGKSLREVASTQWHSRAEATPSDYGFP